MEKSFAIDPAGVRRVIKAGEAAEKKNLKIAAGLMCRHSVNRQELIKRIRDGELGQIQLIRAYRMEPCGPHVGPKPASDRRNCSGRSATRIALPLGLRRAVGRDGHPPDRRDLLAQGRLSGLRPRHRRPGGQQHRPQPEPRLLLRRVDLRRRRPRPTTWSATSPTATTSSPPSSTARSARPSSPGTIHVGTVHIYKDQLRRSRSTTGHTIDWRSARRQGEVHLLAGRVERALELHPQGPAAQRGQAGAPTRT